MSAGDKIDAALTHTCRAAVQFAYMVTKKKIEKAWLRQTIVELSAALKLAKEVEDGEQWDTGRSGDGT